MAEAGAEMHLMVLMGDNKGEKSSKSKENLVNAVRPLFVLGGRWGRGVGIDVYLTSNILSAISCFARQCLSNFSLTLGTIEFSNSQ